MKVKYYANWKVINPNDSTWPNYPMYFMTKAKAIACVKDTAKVSTPRGKESVWCVNANDAFGKVLACGTIKVSEEGKVTYGKL